MSEPIIINNWSLGTSESPNVAGLSLMKNVDIEELPGAVKVAKNTQSLFPTPYTGNFTADAGTDICTALSGLPSNFLSHGSVWVVQFTTTDTLPAGLSLATNYWLAPESTTTFKVATSIDNITPTPSYVNITDAGTGTHTFTSVNVGQINHIVEDIRLGIKYYHDDNARVWYNDGSIYCKLLNGNTLTNGTGNGLVIFTPSSGNHTWLLVFRNALIDIIDIFGTLDIEAPSWTSAWKSLNSGAGADVQHYTILAQDNMVYFCDSKYIGSLRETPGSAFNPADSGTFTYNNKALDLPSGEIANWLEELGSNLLIAGNSFNKIYPWDRVSDSFNLPLDVPENSIKRLKNLGQVVYVLAGSKGNIYTTQGTYITFLVKLPDYVVNTTSKLTVTAITWGGIAASNGSILVGVGGTTTANDGAWRVYPDGRILIDNQPIAGATNVTAFYAENDFYEMGYADGLDKSLATRKTSYEGVINTELYAVGTKTLKGTYSEIEVQLAKPAASGHVRISQRADTSSAWSSAVITCTADGSITSFKDDLGLTDIENMQFQIELDGLVELKEIRII